MAGLSIWHILLFLIIVVVLFGTSKLKGLGRDLGGAVKDFKDSVKNEDQDQKLLAEDTSVIDVSSHTVRDASHTQK